MEEISNYEQQIIESMEKQSKSLMLMVQLSGKVDFRELKADEQFKQTQTKHAARTLEML